MSKYLIVRKELIGTLNLSPEYISSSSSSSTCSFSRSGRWWGCCCRCRRSRRGRVEGLPLVGLEPELGPVGLLLLLLSLVHGDLGAVTYFLNHLRSKFKDHVSINRVETEYEVECIRTTMCPTIQTLFRILSGTKSSLIPVETMFSKKEMLSRAQLEHNKVSLLISHRSKSNLRLPTHSWPGLSTGFVSPFRFWFAGASINLLNLVSSRSLQSTILIDVEEAEAHSLTHSESLHHTPPVPPPPTPAAVLQPVSSAASARQSRGPMRLS